ncbi:uncharacterized protein LOC132924925 [Rhopalosiphum padi]|uniref:uncharacterized protein LOC132924925 n=1 Tax=Rhopalosiphum padi TaxID=40932 RepID=UPI00298E3962|nr:uncharacterized protein LOC132924925 [Rhopalosiphum padi]
MKSIVVLAVLMIPLMFDVAVNSHLDEEVNEVMEVPPGIQDKCPAQSGYSEYYQVTVMSSNTSLVSGCAYIQFNIVDSKRQSFSLWLSNLPRTGKRCREHNYTDMEHYHFNCVLKSPSPSDDTNKGRVYVRLYGPATKTPGKVNVKCAMFETVKGNSTMFRMAISGNVKCNGLSEMLFYPKPMMSMPESNNGSILLRLNRYHEAVENQVPVLLQNIPNEPHGW